MIWLGIAAGITAVVQVYFAYREWFNWDVDFVAKAAPGWIDPAPYTEVDKAHVNWAGPLAKNMAAYNLLLGLALIWTTWAAYQDWAIAPRFGLLLGLFLLGAAAAAGYTGVYLAMKVQGALGLILVLFAGLYLLRSSGG